ncbi:UNVERIFIED_CONTAM: hypothetical protein FKN15_057640 [Acipenser sinensis]
MVAHKEFQNAGKQPGLQIWRIENMDLKPVPKNLYGNFFTGDAYILLHTTQAPSYKLHMWLGEECSQDESGAAAIFATQLDDYLGGKPVQCREVQNYESLSFVGYFKSGIKYQISDATGSMKTSQVAASGPFKQEMLSTSECYILDNGVDSKIFLWKGKDANPDERKSAMKTAEAFVREKNYPKTTQIQILPQGGETTLFKQFFLNWKDKDQTEGPSEAYVVGKIAKIKQIPFDASTLHSDKAMAAQHGMVDDGAGKVENLSSKRGKGANPEERKSAMKTAEAFIKEKNYPKTTQIQIFPQGGETTLFKQFFSNWKDKDQTEGPSEAYVVGKIAKIKQIPFDASTLHSDKAMAAQHGMVDDGAGKVEVAACASSLNTNDVFVLKAPDAVYVWKGVGATDEEMVAAKHVLSLLGGKSVEIAEGKEPVWPPACLPVSPLSFALQVRVTQGQEPPHLMSLFKGKPMVIHSGGTSRKGGQSSAVPVRLFHIRQSSTKATRAVEVAACASSLNTNDVFVLKAPDAVYVWKGVGATDEEMVAAKHVLSLLGGKSVEIAEGKEPGRQGLKCTKDELTASAFLTVKLDDSMGGSPVQVRVTQGQEPPHLMSLFKGKPMVIHSGGTSRKGGQSSAVPVRLFHIRQSSTKATRAVEVAACASSLNTNDVFGSKGQSYCVFVGSGNICQILEHCQMTRYNLKNAPTCLNYSSDISDHKNATT